MSVKKYNGYTVFSARGCRLIQGAVPVDDLVALSRTWDNHGAGQPGWLMANDLAHALGMTLACGPREAIDAWRAELGLLPVAGDVRGHDARP